MKILIADDHSIVRSGLKHLLAELDDEASFVEANSFANARKAALEEGPFDLLMLDLFAPNPVPGTELQSLCDAVAQVPVVIFSMSDDVRDMRHVLDHGAKAFIPKTTEDGLFLSILRMVLEGGTYAPPALAGLGAGDMPAATGGAGSGGLDALTPRQRDVLDMMAQGLSNREVGERLNLNINTVKGHVTAILKVLGVENRTQAVLMLTETRR